MLRRLHHDGYAHNDLHDGNILQNLPHDIFKVIDLGSVTCVDHWTGLLGIAYDRHWSTTRDWRAFVVAFLGLLDGGNQLNVWDLVGTNGAVTSYEGPPCHWSLPGRDGSGELPPEAQRLVHYDGAHWSQEERNSLRAVLMALFAPQADDDDIFMKLWSLAAGDR